MREKTTITISKSEYLDLGVKALAFEILRLFLDFAREKNSI